MIGDWQKIIMKYMHPIFVAQHFNEILYQGNQEVELPEAFKRGLSSARLSGRAQIFYDSSVNSNSSSELSKRSSGDLIFYLDGAHSPESMEVCARWFSNAVKENTLSFLSPQASSTSSLSSFCSSITVGNVKDLCGDANTCNVEENIEESNLISKKVDFLVTLDSSIVSHFIVCPRIIENIFS